MMQPPIAIPDPRNPDMSPEAIDQRLRELAQIYKLGMSLRDVQWLGPVHAVSPAPCPPPPGHHERTPVPPGAGRDSD